MKEQGVMRNAGIDVPSRPIKKAGSCDPALPELVASSTTECSAIQPCSVGFFPSCRLVRAEDQPDVDS
jgi:hypothetical protein